MIQKLGEYKHHLSSIFTKDEKICRLLLGENDNEDMTNPSSELENYILPHLYVEPAAPAQKSFLCFETYMTKATPAVKTIKIVIQAVCHKDILSYDQKPSGYYGTRYDVLSQYAEELLCPEDKEARQNIIKQFGIGGLELQEIDVFSTDNYVGRTMTFLIPTFR